MSRTITHRTMLAVAGIAAIPFAFAFLSPRSAPKATSTPAASNAIASPAQATASTNLYTSLSASTGAITAAALTPAQAGADPYFVEPRVPRAAGTPCVEIVARDVFFAESMSTTGFSWTPSGTCTGPFAKIVLVVETSGPRESGPPAAAMVLHFNNFENQAGPDPGGGALFMGAPQQHDLVGTWRYERDLTEYADMLDRGFQVGYATAPKDNTYHDTDFIATVARAVKLVFYPATSATPAQRTADVMRSLDTFISGSTSWTFEDLPRNIERAYLDVMVRLQDPARAWFSCVPTALADTWPQLDSRFGMGDYRPLSFGSFRGCEAEHGSYREVEVFIDDQRAGLAPVFPALPSTMFFSNVVDYPAPGVQALNVMPYRVDLSPFAAALNDGLPHTVLARVTNSASDLPIVTGQLLLYLDKGRSVVTGALTRNTLAAQPGVPSVTHTMALSGDTLQGDVKTYLRREYTIEGYVDTSKGRVRSTVYQVSRFSNTQSLRVVGPDTSAIPDRQPYEQDYLQKIRLSSTVDRVTRRIRNGVLLAEDKDYTTYPLILDYSNGGFVDWSDEGLPFAFSEHFDLDTSHARGQRASHFRSGHSRYETSLSDSFKGSHSWRDATATAPATDFDWWSTRRYLFTDSRGSCYSAGITTASGELQTRTRGTECPNGVNGLRWYSHPDGAPEAMLWVADP
jgi:hypothetical protein